MRPQEDGTRLLRAEGSSSGASSAARPPPVPVSGSDALVAEERIAFVVEALRAFRDALERRREKAGEIPARGIVLQPLAGKVGIVRAGADEIAAQRVDEPAADGDRA